MIEFLLFDVDNTLYPPTSGLVEQVDARINQFMMQEFGFEPGAVDRKREAYRDAYGTTLRGLMIDYSVDCEDYIAFTHDVPVERLIQQNGQLDEVLSLIPQEKAIFTNGPAEYSLRILDALGIARHFPRLFDLRFLEFLGKPNPSAYRKVLEALGEPRPERCALVEDSVRNLATAQSMGMETVLVGDPSPDWDGARIKDVSQIGQVDFLS